MESSKFENHSKDLDKNLTVPSTSKSIPQQESDYNRSLPKADDCYAKISKWLDLHDVDTQTNRLAPQKALDKDNFPCQSTTIFLCQFYSSLDKAK